jgi:hypothetical protein
VSKNQARWWVGGAVELAGAALCWWLLPMKPEVPAGTVAGSASAAVVGLASPQLTPQAVATASSSATRRNRKPVITPEVERLRARVLDSLGGRPSALPTAPAAVKRAAGELKDHTGELNPETMRILSHEFMPLVEECYDQAHQRNPALGGMLAVNIELAGAEEFGTIIESVDPAPGVNQLADDELLDCVRQSAFSLQLPQPLKSGRASRQLTMPFGDTPERDKMPRATAPR